MAYNYPINTTRDLDMKQLFAFSYEEEFVCDLMYLNERNGQEFDCDGDTMHIKTWLEVGDEKCSD